LQTNFVVGVTWLAASPGRQRAEVLFDGLEDGIRVQLDVPHRLGEEVH
jgi:hypothetical protein